MKTYMECLPCFARQAFEAACMATDDAETRARVLRRTFRMLAEFTFDDCPPEMACRIHAIVREETGHADPYAAAKQRSNRLAVRLLQELRPEVAAADDPFRAALTLAIAANAIDMGVTSERSLGEAEIRADLERAMAAPIAEADARGLQRAVQEASTILYITDNAGEIAFDRLFIEHLPAGRVTAAVRGVPIINDATMADARAVGLPEAAPVISSGSPAPGTLLAKCTGGFLALFESADVVIAKGQGNYESLSDSPRGIFHLFKVKCPVISRDSGRPVGELVVVGPGGRLVHS